MIPRLDYHFEAKKGWINDPNGLVFFKGKYHAFFQHYPYSNKWGQMHWGHAVSTDLIHWDELPIALFPDKPYENSGGCFSGSAVVKDDVLYLFYTSVSHELEQTQSLATSTDGITFTKYDGNPIINHYPIDGCADFRDPKVSKIGNKYYMVCGSGKDGIGKILLYSSVNLTEWDYDGVLLEGSEYGAILECPDFFPYEDKFILAFSQMGRSTHSTMFVYGDFDGKTFTPISYHTPEAGPQFYAPQTFLDDKGRRIIIGWIPNWGKEIEDLEYACALSIPREIKVVNGKILNFPVSEAYHLLSDTDELVDITDTCVTIKTKETEPVLKYECDCISDVKILRDTKVIEVFINQGEASFTYWFA